MVSLLSMIGIASLIPVGNYFFWSLLKYGIRIKICYSDSNTIFYEQ